MAPPAWNAGFSRHSGPQGRGWFLATPGGLARAAEPSRQMRSFPPPACGGLCRLKPAFQAVSAVFMTGGVCRWTDHDGFFRWGPSDRHALRDSAAHGTTLPGEMAFDSWSITANSGTTSAGLWPAVPV